MLCALSSVRGQEVSFSMTITNIIPGSRPSGTFTFGAHPAATNGLDVERGEREIPSLPPPAGVFIIYTVPPTPDVVWLSPKDVRALSPDSAIRHEYDVRVTWTGGRLELSLPRRLPAAIDSAYIVDAITDFPNNFIKQRVDSGLVYSTDNPAITRLKLLVWYRQATTSVAETITPSITLAPNPSTEMMTVRGCEPGSVIQLYSALGIEYLSVRSESTDTHLRVDDLPIGAYIVRVNHLNGVVTQHVMMRQ